VQHVTYPVEDKNDLSEYPNNHPCFESLSQEDIEKVQLTFEFETIAT